MIQSAHKFRFVHLLRRDMFALSSFVFLVLVVLAAIFAPLIASGNITIPDYGARLLPPLSQGHVFGTDQLGRDVFGRIVYGARTTVSVAVVSVAIAGFIGITVGLVSAYFGGVVDNVVMRIADVQLSFPFIVLALTVNVILGSGLRNIIFTLAITGWVEYARIMRGEVLSIREAEYVQAAKISGGGDLRIMFRHIFPNAVSPLIVTATMLAARFIVAEASISFLGFGVQPPTPAWGSMINEGASHMYTGGWWLVTIPGIVLALVSLSINIVGDWVRDVLDPKVLS